MNKYFYTDGTEKFGPYSFEELKSCPIDRKTLVWFHPMTDWKPAGNVEELKELFTEQPPEFPGTPVLPRFAEEKPPMPKTWFVESILITVLCCLPFGIVGLVKASQVETLYYGKEYAAALAASSSAKKWVYWGFGVSVVGIVLYALFIGILVLIESSQTSDNYINL